MLRKTSLLAALAIFTLALVVPAGQALAASSDAVNITVTISTTLGVEVTEGSYDFGTLSTSTSVKSASSLEVTNTGSGIDETYSLSCSNTADWTAGGTATADVFVLSAKFNTTQPASFVANDVLSTTPVAADGTHFAGDQTGASVPYNAARDLWLQLQTPTSTASTDEQTSVLTVTAAAS